MSNTWRFLILWLLGFVAFTVMDLIWLGVVAAPFYRAQVGALMNPEGAMTAAQIAAALCTWLLIILALLLFALPRAVQRASAATALGLGAVLGFIIYGVYDLTNLAVLHGWSWTVTVVDIAWGTFACGTASLFLWAMDRWLPKRVQAP